MSTSWTSVRRKRKPRIAIHVSRETIETFTPPEDCFIISITDPGSPDADIKPHDRIKGIHRVPKFHDIDPDPETGKGVLRMAFALQSLDPATYRLFDDDLARSIAIAVVKMENEGTMPPLIVVHCEAGVFRSAAIAAALQMHYRMDCPSAFKTGHPNRLVYRLTLNALTALRGPRS